MAKQPLSLKIEDLETIRELSAQEITFIGGGHDVISTHLTIGCPGNGRPVHRHYSDGTSGSTCVYDEPILRVGITTIEQS